MKKTFFIAAIIAAIGFIIYSNALSAGFFLDDHPNILRNTSIRSLSNIGQLWSKTTTRFLAYLTFALNWQFAKDQALSYHAVNILVHCFNSILVFLLAVTLHETPLLKRLWPPEGVHKMALFTALIFLTHPVQTQAVTYIVQRITSLAAFWYLLALLLYVKIRLRFDPFLYACALVAACCAMLTKEISITLPLAVLLCEVMFFDNSAGTRKRFLRLLPFLCCLLIVPLVLKAGLAERGGLAGLTRETALFSRKEYALTQINVVGTYLRLLFLPFNQQVVYDYPITAHLNIKTAGLLFAVLLIIGWAILNYKKYRLAAFGIFWFFLTLGPESSFIPITDVIQEHRLYLPILGFAFLISAAGFYLLKNKIMSQAFCLLLIAVYSGLTSQRNAAWKSGENLLARTVAEAPNSGLAFSQMGSLYFEKNDYAKAKEYFTRAVQLSPDPVDYLNLSTIAIRENEPEAAIGYCFKAMAFKGWNPSPALNNLGIAFLRKGMRSKARKAFEQSAAVDPLMVESRFNLADMFLDENEYGRAADLYEEILAIDPAQKEARARLIELPR